MTGTPGHYEPRPVTAPYFDVPVRNMSQTGKTSVDIVLIRPGKLPMTSSWRPLGTGWAQAGQGHCELAERAVAVPCSSR